MLNSKQIIIVDNIQKTSKATLTFYNNSKKILQTQAFIGKNGITENKVEGDGKTPKGIFELGLVFGTHNEADIELNKNIKYIKINKNLYWVDDINSKYYNQLVDITKVGKDWNSAEHLIEYPTQYEYAIEIKTNTSNSPGKGSAIFLHCSVNEPTQGCVTIDRTKIIEILKNVDKREYLPRIMIK